MPAPTDSVEIPAIPTSVVTAAGTDIHPVSQGGVTKQETNAQILSYIQGAIAIPLAQISDASANGRSLVAAANYAAMLTLLSAAPLASPTFTGVPAAPTAAPGTNTTQLATTAFATTAASAATVADGDKGDVTVSGSGAVWTIDNDVVTYAKMQDVSATDRVLGRSTAGAGDVEEIIFTAAARALADDTTAAAMRVSLGVDAYTGVADANYGAAATDKVIAYTSITVSRTVTLPAASALNPGQELLIADASGSVTTAITITIARAGADTINGATSTTIAVARGAVRLVSDGISKWLIAAIVGSASVTDTTSGTTTIPVGCTRVRIRLSGPGGGAGSGRRGAAGSIRGGGGGAAAGQFTDVEYSVSELGGPGTTLTYTLPAGGAGGAAPSSDSTDGANGVAGALASVAIGAQVIAQAAGGAGGSAGTSAVGGAGGGSSSSLGTYGSPAGGTGSDGSATGSAGNRAGPSASSAGGGGGVSAANTGRAGGAGAAGGAAYGNSTTATGGATGATGVAGAVGAAPFGTAPGSGGGGGGGGTTNGGGAGGAGTRGGGGGGGGGGTNGATGGDGGQGGGAWVRFDFI